MNLGSARRCPPIWFLFVAITMGVALGEVVYRSWTGPVLVEPFLQQRLDATAAEVRNQEPDYLPK